MPRKRLILAPLTAIAAFGVTTPSPAADFGIGAANFDFTPKTQTIAVGDTVTWTFNDDGHSTTSVPGQPDRWDSDIRDEGETFQRTFAKPGRYQYVCTPHEGFMRGTLVVGKDTVSDTVDALKAQVSGKQATVSFKLNEPALATLKLTGAGKRTVRTKRLKAGKRSITVKRLKPGTYKGTLTLLDDFDKKATQKKSFTVR